MVKRTKNHDNQNVILSTKPWQQSIYRLTIREKNKQHFYNLKRMRRGSGQDKKTTAQVRFLCQAEY